MNASPPSKSQRGTWLLAAFLAVLGVLGGAWVWLEVDSAEKHADIDAPAAMKSPTVTETMALATSTADSSASDEIAAPAGAGRTHAGPKSAATAAKPWAHGVIRGRVLGGPGAAEPMAAIGVRATSPRSAVPIPEKRATTDAQGWFEIRNMVAAEWELSSFLVEFDLSGRAVARIDEDNPSAEVEILLPYARKVDVVVVDAQGRPIRAEMLGLEPAFLPLLGIGLDAACRPIGATLSPGDAPRHRCLDRSAKGERNTWELVIQSADAGCVHALFADRVIAARPLGKTEQRVEFVLDATQIAANIVPCTVQIVSAADGAPVTDGNVRFQMAAGVNLSLSLDKEGRAALPRCPVGRVDLSIVAPGFVTRAATLTLPADTSTRHELIRARKLAGRVVLEGGREAGIYRPSVWRIEDPTARLVGSSVLASQFERNGAFSFDALEPAFYVVAAVPESVRTFTAEDVRAGKAGAAAYVDLRHGDVNGLVLTVPTWLR